MDVKLYLHDVYILFVIMSEYPKGFSNSAYKIILNKSVLEGTGMFLWVLSWIAIVGEVAFGIFTLGKYQRS